MAEFIECTSLSVSYDITGLATVSYTVISDSSGIKAYNTISFGGRIFQGYVMSASVNIIPRSESDGNIWYQTQVSLLAVAS